MKYLIACEGPNEKAVLDILMESNKLKIKKDELLGLTIYFVRQIKNSSVLVSEINSCDEEIKIIRIGDTQKEKFVIPKEFKSKINEKIDKYCTKPELEFLLIINENKIKEFCNQSRVDKNCKAKSFAKANVKLGKKKYNCTCDFYREYYQDVNVLIKNIRYYAEYKRHKLEELYLASLISED